MTNKEKIRKEVERIINRRLNLINGDYFDLNKETNGFTNEIMYSIDSLQEEPIGKVWHYQKEEPIDEIADKSRPIVVIYGYNSLNAADKFRCYDDNSEAIWLSNYYEKWAFMEDLINLSQSVKTSDQEDPELEGIEREVAEGTVITEKLGGAMQWLDDFEEEADRFFEEMPVQEHENIFEDTFKNIARHFAEWQKKKDEKDEADMLLVSYLDGAEKGKKIMRQRIIGEVRSILNKVAFEYDALDVNGDICEQPFAKLNSEFRKLMEENV